jgi:hypothetical protein
MALSWPRAALAGEVTIVPSAEGRFGAWLALGPISANAKRNRAPRNMETGVLADADEAGLTGRLGRSVSITVPDGDADAPTAAVWRVINSGGGPIDVATSLNHKGGEAFAFLYGVLHLSEPFKGALLVGSSDGARVFIDKKMVSSSDGHRPERDDEDVTRLNLAAGDHPIVIKLHHRDTYWAVRVRIVDATFAAPRGASLRLPGTGDSDARSLAQRMADIDVDRGLLSGGFRPKVGVSFPRAAAGTDRFVRVAATARNGGKAVASSLSTGRSAPRDGTGQFRCGCRSSGKRNTDELNGGD